MIEHLDKLKAAGVTSFKIEGRAKSDYYVGVVTNAYRLAMDDMLKDPSSFKIDPRLLDELRKVSHREYYTGFYFDEKSDNSQCYKSGGYVREYDVVAVVDRCDDNYIYLTQRNKFSLGEMVDILEPKGYPFEVKIEKILDENSNEIDTANHAMMKIKIPKFKDLKEGSLIRKARD
jgi:putative protease